MERRSNRINKSTKNEDNVEVLFQQLMVDPIKSTIVKSFLSQVTQSNDINHLQSLLNSQLCSHTSKQNESKNTSRKRKLATIDRDISNKPKHLKICNTNENLLEDIVAYVEVCSQNGKFMDWPKDLLRSLGAVVVETFTEDVTHVIFKGGSLQTYKTAKMRNVHCLSILWLDAVHRNKVRVPEERYYAHNPKSTLLQTQRENQFESQVEDEFEDSLELHSVSASTSYSYHTTTASDDEIIEDSFTTTTSSKELPSSRTVSGLCNDSFNLLHESRKNSSKNVSQRSRYDLVDMDLTSPASEKEIILRKSKKNSTSPLKICSDNLKNISSNTNVDNSETMPSLRISTDRSSVRNSKHEEDPFAVTAAPFKSSTKAAKCSDKNEINGGENRKKEEPKVGQRTRRKLFNNDSINASLILKQREQQSLEQRKNVNENAIQIVPVLMTRSAKRLVKNKRATTPKSKSVTKKPVKPKPVKKKVIKKTAKRADDADEQHELFNEILNRPAKCSPVSGRRSTLEFISAEDRLTQKSKKTGITIKSASIVCTRFHTNEVREFNEIVEKLGRFIFELNVTAMTTHLVVGESKRTLNLLKAIVRGCWIVKSEWVFKSFQAKRWLPEEDFELAEFSPAVQKCRKERQAFGSAFSMDIFANCGPIYVSKNLEAPYIQVRELVRLCKGDACKLRRTAKIVIGEYVNDEEVVCVSQQWIFDSIITYKKKSFRQYLLEPDL